ncbi:MAG: nucleotide exchange factor GrpE [Crocinitomicaceae bacterium]|nr:nucleotide exchange factor GrpE [Crocinitomicaceae bacterium]
MSEEKMADEKELKEENEAVMDEQENADLEASENADGNETKEPELDKFSALEEELKVANDKYLRIYSEFENFRRRTAKEKLELISSASEGLMSEIIPVLDDFDRAIKTNKESDDIDAIREGMTLVHQKFHSILKSKGLQEMNSMGKEFNIDEHEALTKIPAPNKKLKGRVVDVIEKGYKLNDKVVRYAKVVVGE